MVLTCLKNKLQQFCHKDVQKKIIFLKVFYRNGSYLNIRSVSPLRTKTELAGGGTSNFLSFWEKTAWHNQALHFNFIICNSHSCYCKRGSVLQNQTQSILYIACIRSNDPEVDRMVEIWFCEHNKGVLGAAPPLCSPFCRSGVLHLPELQLHHANV